MMGRKGGVLMKETVLVYREIKTDGGDYSQTLELRDQVLRKPWGQSIKDDDLSGEPLDFIYGAFDGSRLVGMAILQDRGEAYSRLRYMAVDPAYQGRGIGTAICREFETRSRESGKAGIRLMARIKAVDFYQRLGYRKEGKPYFPGHIAIEHVDMILTFHG